MKISKQKIIDMADKFLLDPYLGLNIVRYNARYPSDMEYDGKFVISNNWSYADYFSKDSKFIERDEAIKDKKNIYFDSVEECIEAYMKFIRKNYFMYVKGSGDVEWTYRTYSENLDEKENVGISMSISDYFEEISKRHDRISHIIVDKNRKIIKEYHPEGKKQEFNDYFKDFI